MKSLKSEKAPSARNYGIDLLRILAAFYVVILHSLGHGGAMQASARGSHQYMVIGFLEIWAYCSVDLFALISGYVGYSPRQKRLRLSRYFELWLEVVFYCVVPSLIILLTVPGTVTGRDILMGLFPVTTGRYWYFSSYTGLFLVIPILDAALRALDTGYLKIYIGVVLIAFCLYASPMERFSLGSGYSMVWLILLYLCGGAVHKIQEERKRGKHDALICILLIIGLALFAWTWLINRWHFTFFDTEVSRTTMMSYTAFSVCAAAILHLILFSRLQIPGKIGKYLPLISSGAFAVYLLNTQPAIWTLSQKQFEHLGTASSITILLQVLGYALLFVLLGAAVDLGRRLLFKVLHIPQLAARLEALIRRIPR